MRSGPREGIEPACPFCRASLARPVMTELNTMESVPVGTCGNCGAIYVADITGKNVGEVMIQALGLLARRLSRDMSELVAGEDYEDVILSYDWRLHRSSGESRGFMDRYGRLYVIKGKQKQP